MTIKVYLVDDHALVREGLKMILRGEVDIEVVGESRRPPAFSSGAI